MNTSRRLLVRVLFCALCALLFACRAAVGAPLGGFIPFVGIGLTNQFKTLNDEATFFISDPSFAWGGTPLGPGSPGSPAYFDLALLDPPYGVSVGFVAGVLGQLARTALTADHRPVEFNEITMDGSAYVLQYDFDA
jgi:hypothetical protein